MTEPVDAPPMTVDSLPPPTGDPDNVLDTFKTGADGTDNDNVHDAIGGRPRLNWSPVTDGGGRAPTERADESSGFHFDLGGALARLGDPPTDNVPPTVAAPAPAPAPAPPPPPPPVVEYPLPQRSPSGTPPSPPVAPAAPTADYALPQRAPVAPTPDPAPLPLEPLPRRGERPAAEAPVAPSPVTPRESTPGPYATARRSVFDDAGSNPGTTMPPSVRPPATPIVPATVAPAVAQAAAPAVAAVPTFTPASAGPAVSTLPTLPTLPPAVPHATPMYSPPIDSAPATPDINAFRSAQLRASRQKRKGKLFSRTLLALFVLGLAVAAALYFGRQYLYPTAWDASLTPIVDDIQNDRGVEFDHTVGVVKQPSADYALTIGRLVVDDGWLEQVPVWRALGLTTGEPTADGIAPALASARLAVYDPDADRIYMSADADPEAAAPDLRLALEEAFTAQFSEPAAPVDEPTISGFVGVSSPEQIADSAVAHYLARRETATTVAPADPGESSALPIPIEYELAAVDDLGEALLTAAGLDPATVQFGSPYPDALAAALDDGATATSSGALQVGDRSLAPPIAIGVDDWSLVWGARLPQSTVDQLSSVVVADSFRSIDRGGVICAIAVFQTANATDTASVVAAMQTWAAASPVNAQSTVSQLSDTRVQLSTCDPGADATSAPEPGDVDGLINRQLTRLAG